MSVDLAPVHVQCSCRCHIIMGRTEDQGKRHIDDLGEVDRYKYYPSPLLQTELPLRLDDMIILPVSKTSLPLPKAFARPRRNYPSCATIWNMKLSTRNASKFLNMWFLRGRTIRVMRRKRDQMKNCAPILRRLRGSGVVLPFLGHATNAVSPQWFIESVILTRYEANLWSQLAVISPAHFPSTSSQRGFKNTNDENEAEDFC